MSRLHALTVLALAASGALAQQLNAAAARPADRARDDVLVAQHSLAPLGDTTTPAPEFSSPSTLSRDEVQAEAARARGEHSLGPLGDTTTPAPEYLTPSTRSRDDVRAEGREAAHRRHQVDDLSPDY